MVSVVSAVNELDMGSLISRVGGLPVAPVDDELVILNAAGGNYIGLDDIGRRIWELLEKPMRVDQLLHQIIQDYTGDRETITLDLLDFLGELRAQNLITTTEPSGAATTLP